MQLTSKSIVDLGFASYSEVADEYYDPAVHPTCANFRSASKALLADLGIFEGISARSVLELGAGRSLVAEMMIERGVPLDRLVITDKYEEMLSHSKRFEMAGARLQVLDASNVYGGVEKFDLIVAVLADPYNTPALWKNLLRLSSKRGLIALTFPSYDWMKSYRLLKEHVESKYSVFQTREGSLLNLPSFIWPTEKVIKYGRSVDLILLKHLTFRVAHLSAGNISPKLLSSGDDQLPIVEGYLFQNNNSFI